jgi:hypothetical protein
VDQTSNILSLCQAHGRQRLVEDSRKEAASCSVQEQREDFV